MKVIFAGILAAVFALFGFAPAAQADTPGCITWREFKSVKDGWRRSSVINRFDVRPDSHAFVAGGNRVDVWVNATCSTPRRDVAVTFDRRQTGSGLAYVVVGKCWRIGGKCR